MKTSKIVLAVAFASVAFVYLAQTQLTDVGDADNCRYGWGFYVGGTNYSTYLIRSNILSSPSWSPSDPLPLRPDRAVDVARKQLLALGKAPEEWYPKEIILKCVGHTPPSDDFRAWYYVIHFEPKRPSQARTEPAYELQSIYICVDFFGKPGTLQAGDYWK